MSKVCTKCGVLKESIHFYKDGKRNRSDCKVCNKNAVKRYCRTKVGLMHTMYTSQVKRSKKRGYAKPTYSYKEFEDWLLSQVYFHVLYDNWKRIDYQRNLAPSVDRKNDYISYTMANIQLMTSLENVRKGGKHRIKGLNTKSSRSVNQYDLKLKFIDTHYSVQQAGRTVGVDSASIIRCCKQTQLTSAGYKWRYA